MHRQGVHACWRSSRRPRPRWSRPRRAARAGTPEPSGSITVWVDAVRLPVAKLYAKTHPNVHLNIVTYDGDGNGATTMQTKIQLWNRTGNGWPDVIFSEQANDPVWMGAEAVRLRAGPQGRLPEDLLKGWPAPSLAQCTVNGHLVCLQDNLAQEVLYVNKKLMKPVRLHGSDDVAAVGGARRRRSPREHPGYIIGNIGDSYGAWLYLWADKCPISQVIGPNTVRINAGDVHCTRMASLLDPLIKSGVGPARERLHRRLRQEVGRRQRQDPDDAGPDVVREGHLQRHAARPGRRADGRDAAALEQRAARDRPGRRRPVDRLQAHEEHGGCRSTS